ncbi:MAG: bifunctional nuclease family protein [Myxococcota bacterium]|nr:bifunctional nuclease family protein [Myxococcota bacterium]
MSDAKVFVDRVLFDPNVGTCVVLLKESGTGRVLPIWIGQTEAFAIVMAMENIALPRPMTHDLMWSILQTTDIAVDWIRVHSMEAGTFFATMRLRTPSGEKDIDARPSDAIAVAVRAGTPIFVSEQVLAESVETGAKIPDDLKQIKEDFLANLPDEVFGKYKM